jgi:hypothetical protein
MGYWIIGSKSAIFLNKYHRNTHSTDKLDNVSQVPHPITPSLHYSGYKILRLSRRKRQDDEQNKKRAEETGTQQKEICDSRCRK